MMTARARASGQSFEPQVRIVGNECTRRLRRLDRREHCITRGWADRLADSGDMENARAADHVVRQRFGTHPRRGGARAQVREFMSVGAVGDEIHAGRRRRVGGDAVGVDAFAPPQFEEHPAECIVADAGRIAHPSGPGEKSRRRDRHVRRIAAETAQVVIGRVRARLVELDHRFAQRDDGRSAGIRSRQG